jgi:methyl-accepting chemotaxis protein
MKHFSALLGSGSITLRIYFGFGILLLLLAAIASYGWLQVQRTATSFGGYAASAGTVDSVNHLQTQVADLQRTAGEFVTVGSAEKKVEVTQRAEAVSKHLEELGTQISDVVQQEHVQAISKLNREVDENLLTLYERVTLRQEVEDGLNYDDRDIRKALKDLVGGKSEFGNVLDRYLGARALTIRFATSGKDEPMVRAELAKVAELGAKLASELKEDDDLKDAYDDLTGGLKRYLEDLGRLSNALVKRAELAVIIDQLSDKMRAEATEVKQITARLQDATRASVADAATSARSWMLMLSLTSLAFAALIGFAIARSITVPVRSLSGAMRRLAAGDIAIDVPALGRHDEIGQMAATVQVFKENAERIHTLQEEKLAGEQRAEAEKRATLMRLADEFESAVGTIVTTVSSSSGQLEASAGTLASTAEQAQDLATLVASASEEASVNVQSVASATEELSSSINEISRQVQQSARMASEAVEQARTTTESVGELSKAAARIGDVVELISTIAGQTNLLALNATIEAARAGEAGRGFAVVASEVKALAQQTAKATCEISEQISGIQAATQGSVSAIIGISTTIEKLSQVSSTIAAAVEEQGAATREISCSVQQASHGTHQVSSNITDVQRGASETGLASSMVLAAAKSLSNESGHLRAQVDRFLFTVRAV